MKTLSRFINKRPGWQMEGSLPEKQKPDQNSQASVIGTFSIEIPIVCINPAKIEKEEEDENEEEEGREPMGDVDSYVENLLRGKKL